MTRALAARWRLLGLAAVALVSARCVIIEYGIGDACVASAECIGELVCVLVDEDEPRGDAVCMPMIAVEAGGVACEEDDDCLRAGFPVDATCDAFDQICSCEFIAVGFICDDGGPLDPETCRCRDPG